MTNSKLIFILILLNIVGHAFSQKKFPGGVAGAEAWYIARDGDNESIIHYNHGTPHIDITTCGEPIGEPSLFNFNPSFQTEELCLKYKASLENTTSRNIFFVGEPKNTEDFSHITTSWNTDLNPIPTSTIRNRFDIANDAALVTQQSLDYHSVSNANVNFYSWNVYQTDRRFKSYGLDGETNFYIGREFQNDTIDAKSYSGNFPEFVSFPFDLTANQRNRVDSYLALKYGITLSRETPYRDSKNKVFWKKTNNLVFGSRIFGLGCDAISGLQQFMSESVHQKDFLVASIGELAENNTIKQQGFHMDDRNFIVFGDNGYKPAIDNSYEGQIKKLLRVWLSQNTGNETRNYGTYFRLNLEGELKNRLTEDPQQRIWLMRDRLANNQEESEFQGQGIDYYPADEILGDNQYALFKDIYFDQDWSIHDQFTFGIGPEMIVQVIMPDLACDGKSIKATIKIIGGTAPYTIEITGPNGLEVFTIPSDMMAYTIQMQSMYNISATDSNGVIATTVVDTNVPSIEVDFGPDITINPTENPVTLNAGINVADPEATYAWYLDDVLLDYSLPTLTVSGPGSYTVIITSGNKVCQMSDTINISYNFSGTIDIAKECEQTEGAMTVTLSGGTAPFTTTISGPGQNLTFVHSNESLSLTQLQYGNYVVYSTDSNGLEYTENVTLEHPMGANLNLLSQLTQNCVDGDYYLPSIGSELYTCAAPGLIVMDASNPYLTFDWYIDNIFTGVTSSTIEIADQPNPTGNFMPVIKVVVTNTQTGCTQEESIRVKGQFIIHESSATSQTIDVDLKEQIDSGHFLEATVYPNPSEKDTNFHYRVSSDQVFEGTVEIYNPLGALLQQVPISGQAHYELDFNLQTSGMYFIMTRTNEKTITDKIVIK